MNNIQLLNQLGSFKARMEKSPDRCEFVTNLPYTFISSTLTFWLPVFVMLLVYYRVYREALRQKAAMDRITNIRVLPLASNVVKDNISDVDEPNKRISLESGIFDMKSKTRISMFASSGTNILEGTLQHDFVTFNDKLLCSFLSFEGEEANELFVEERAQSLLYLGCGHGNLLTLLASLYDLVKFLAAIAAL